LHLHLQTLDQGAIIVDASKDSDLRPGDRVTLEVDPSRLMRATEA